MGRARLTLASTVRSIPTSGLTSENSRTATPMTAVSGLRPFAWAVTVALPATRPDVATKPTLDSPGATVPFTLVGAWHEVRFAPGGRPGERVVVDGRPLADLDDEAAAAPEPGAVRLRFIEGVFSVADVEVSGRAVRPDRPALARVPAGPLPVAVRVAAAFTRDGPGAGGPVRPLATGARTPHSSPDSSGRSRYPRSPSRS